MLSKTAPWNLSAPRMISWCPLIAWRKERRSDVGRVLSRQPWAVIINVPASRAQSIFPFTLCLAQTCAVPPQPSHLYGWTSHRPLRLLDSGVFGGLTLVDTASDSRPEDNHPIWPLPGRPSLAGCVHGHSGVDARHQPANAMVPWRGHGSSAIVKTP